jgi:hypothetical protein
MRFTILLLAVLISNWSSHMSLCESNRCVVYPKDNGMALVNPQMGWTFHYYSNQINNYGSRLKPSDTLDDFPGLSVVYLRLPWSFIEPEEGVFTWSIVDTPAQRWIDKGKQVAFRFSCSESWLRYATPKWVEEAGAKGYNFSPGELRKDGAYWEPDYGDPIFLDKLDQLLAVAASRYDGNPNVAFIDIGSLGVWGEGHTFSSTRLKYPSSVLKTHIDLHTKHFKRTLLAVNDDFSLHGDDTLIDYAFKAGLTLRDDSILVQAPPHHYYHADFAQLFWPKLPVILENEHYGASRDKGIWGDGSKYLEAVEEYHASYVSIHWWPREFMTEQAELIQKINRRLGYRLQLKEISWPAETTINAAFTVSMKWGNAGVAPCYPGGYVALTLKDQEGGIVSVFVDQSQNVETWDVGPVDHTPVRNLNMACAFARNMKPGLFDVFVSVGQRDGTPKIALPLTEDDGHKRYKLGSIKVKGTE